MEQYTGFTLTLADVSDEQAAMQDSLGRRERRGEGEERHFARRGEGVRGGSSLRVRERKPMGKRRGSLAMELNVYTYLGLIFSLLEIIYAISNGIFFVCTILDFF